MIVIGSSMHDDRYSWNLDYRVHRISVFFIEIYYQLVYATAIIPNLSFCRMTLGSAFRLCPAIKQLDYELEISIAR